MNDKIKGLLHGMKFACCIANKGCNDDLDILPMFPPPHKSQLTSMLSIFQGFAQIEGRRFKKAFFHRMYGLMQTEISPSLLHTQV